MLLMLLMLWLLLLLWLWLDFEYVAVVVFFVVFVAVIGFQSSLMLYDKNIISCSYVDGIKKSELI